MLTAKDIFVVGVAGGSGSGKTTLTENLVQRFSDHICVVHHDNYYKPHDDLSFEARTKLNYDCPDAFETPLLAQQLRQLRQGQPVDCPTYDYAHHTRAKATVRLVPQPVILLEGILIFAEPELCDLMDLKVFVDTDADVRLARRMLRDLEERGRSVRSVIDQWQDTVKPMHEKYVEPSKGNADIIIPTAAGTRWRWISSSGASSDTFALTRFLKNASIFEKNAAGCMHSLRSHTYPSEKRKK